MTLPLDVPGAPGGPGALVVCGLDISLTATGICDGRTAWTVGETGKKGATWAERGDRIRRTRIALVHALWDCGPALIVIEAPSYGSTDPYAWDRAGLYWAVVGVLQKQGTPLAFVAPGQLKKYATGKGNAKKGAVLEAVVRRFPHIAIGGDDNRADAAVLAAMGYQRLGQPLAVLPALQTAVVDAIDWPEVRLP